MKLQLVILITLFASTCALGQHGPLVSQYMLNGLPLNPAFSGTHDALSVAASYRNQWTGFEGAPITQTFSAHTPLKHEEFAVGILAYGDRLGVTRESGLTANFAYRVDFPQGKLSMGLSGGIRHAKNSWNEVITNESGDQVFTSGNDQWTLPDFGAGFYFYSKKYYASLSVPSFFSPRYAGGQSYRVQHDFGDYNLYLNGGYVVDINSEFQLLPSMMLRVHAGSPLQMDINLRASYRDMLECGFSFRTGDAVVTMLKAYATPQLSLGYAYDYTISDLNKYSNGSHEVTITYDLKYKTEASNPRFF